MDQTCKADGRVREFVRPVRILMAEGNVSRAELLAERFADQIGLKEREGTQISGRCRILLDFGRELHGGLRIVAGAGRSGTRVRLRLGESANEALADIGERGATNDHSLRDLTLPLP